jgi:hypothetical protein
MDTVTFCLFNSGCLFHFQLITLKVNAFLVEPVPEFVHAYYLGFSDIYNAQYVSVLFTMKKIN